MSSSVNLNPKTPRVQIKTPKDAFSQELFQFCLENPITVVEGLCSPSVCDFKLGKFSTLSLTKAWPDHPIEIRTQKFKSAEKNVPMAGRNSWDCYSARSQMTIRKYGEYQGANFLREKNGVGGNSAHGIQFGTNLDLSDAKMWQLQLQEFNKLPPAFKLYSPGNLLSYVGHNILGMNTVQLYMKVKGSRTPGHEENNKFCAVNINVGPGDCEWFGVADEYWPAMYKLCQSHGMNYLKGSWWPDPEECFAAGIPVYRFIQRPGDLVYINIGCVHWVQSLGVTNNIAWNVGPLVPLQFRAALERYDFNKVENYKSIVPMILLSWNIGRTLWIRDPEFFQLVKKVLSNSLDKSRKDLQQARRHNVPIRHHGKKEGEPVHYCGSCEEEVFNTLFIKKNEKRPRVFCLECALQSSPQLEDYACLQEYTLDELTTVYENFKRLE
ncbi:Lysine-specific demethylase 6A [Folsomia candida]|uniref:Lysine-specific demethylase 6A n=2 Tax=Folsomia candida TaxID=158441 RepID=A0A226EL98_FOLCA|nr:Lysine-specific demethylase 6A [Folsomia candida]